jgi:hypothetical protein
MFRLLLAGLLLCAPIIPGWAADAGRDVVVTVVTGIATVAGKPVGYMDRLASQHIVELGQGANLVLFRFRDGVETTLTGPGTFLVRDRDIGRIAGTGTLQVRQMDAALRRVPPDTGGLTQAGITLRAGGATDTPMNDSPRLAERVEPGTATFRWSARAHEGDYRFLLADADADDHVLAEARLAGCELALTDVQLVPGTRYRWELMWRDPAGQMRMVTYRFATLSAADAATLARLRPPVAASGSEKVLFGWWLRSVGAHGLAEGYPGQSEATR